MGNSNRMSDDNLRKSIIYHEEIRLKPYLDCCGKYWRDCVCVKKGNLTIGAGRNLDSTGITQFETMFLLRNDIERVKGEAVSNFAWFKSLCLARQDVVLEMLFNLGIERFLGFKRMIEAIRVGDFQKASNEMLCSEWAGQVKRRAVNLSNMMRSGEYSF
jgi:lysozyme